MQILTPTGYKDITLVNVGDAVVAYDMATDVQTTNILQGKELWTETMFPAVPPTYETDADGNIVLDGNGDPIVLDAGMTSEEVYQATYGDWKFYEVNGVYTLFCNQSIWANGRVVHASELVVGDTIYDGDDQDVVITSITEVSGTEWWRLDISGNHTYIADDVILHNSSRYWVGGGSSQNWSATGNTNWGSASGVQDNSSVPTSADDAIFDGGGGAGVGDSNSTISATITVLSLTITTGYTSTMTHDAVLTIAGNWTFVNTYTIAGASGITISANSTITSNGTTWTNDLTFSTISTTRTLVGNLTIGGLFTVNNSCAINKTTNEVIYLLNGINSGGTITGNIEIYLQGGTWTGGRIGVNLFLDGNITLASAISYGGATLKYLSGTITTTGSTLSFIGINTVLDVNSINWNNVTCLSSTPGITLLSNFNINGLLTVSSSTTINRTTAETITCAGGMTINAGLSGTADINWTGGTWTQGATTYNIANNLTIAGNVTLSGANTSYGTGTLTYSSGTVTTTGNTLNIRASCTLNTNGITWNNLTFSTTNTTTLTSNLTVNGLVTINASAATVLNKTTAETATFGNGITQSSQLSGTADIYWTGGTWTANGNAILNNLFIQGNVTFSGTCLYQTGTLTYVSGVVTTTGSTFRPLGTCTLNVSAITWASFLISSTTTVTLTSNLNIGGLLTISGAATINRTTAETVTIAGGMTISAVISGTADIYLNGGTWNHPSSTAYIVNNLFINGNVTLGTSVVYGNLTTSSSSTLKYLSGTITTTGNTLYLYYCTLDTSAITWNNVTVQFSGATITLTSDLNLSGTLTGHSTQNCTFNATITEKITCYGLSLPGRNISGTVSIYIKGGTWQQTSGTIYLLAVPLYIDGNVTITGTVGISSACLLTYLSGSVTTTGSLLYLNGTGTFTLNTNGVTWNNFTSDGSTKTVSLTSNLSIGGLLAISGITTINRTTAETITCAGGLAINNALQGTAEIIWTGGTWSQNNASNRIANNLTINGNVAFGTEPVYSAGTLTYQSGNITWSPAQTLLFRDNAKVDLKGILVNQNVSVTSGGMTLLSNLVINGNYSNGTTISANATTNETITVFGNFSAGSGGFGGTAKVIVKGGTMSSESVSIPFTCPIELDGNIRFGSVVTFQNTSVRYVSGTIVSRNSLVRANAGVFLIGFNRMPLTRIEVQAGQTLTCDQLPVGSEDQILQISSSGANYTIAFQDTFEKIGRNVALSGATLSRPMQLLVTTNPRFNTNRSTNALGIRYFNQIPNGVPKNVFPIADDSLTGVQGGLVSDPCFQRQG